MEKLNLFLESSAGKVTAVVLILAVCAGLYKEFRSVTTPQTVMDERTRWFVDAQTGKAFLHEMVIGEAIPIYSPYSGKNTGYPAELCYWNKDGTFRADNPTPVLMNEYVGKSGPTFCPVCGRLVVFHNPYPRPNSSPPPTQQEWEQEHQASAR